MTVKKPVLLLSLLVALVLLGAAAVLLLRARPAPPPLREAAPMTQVYALSAPVRSVGIAVEGKTPYTLIRTDTGTGAAAGVGRVSTDGAIPPGEAVTAVIAGLESYPLIEGKVSTIFARASAMSATERLTEESDGDADNAGNYAVDHASDHADDDTDSHTPDSIGDYALDYTQFGLDPPRVRVSVAADDGEQVVFLIGREAPGHAETYVRLEDDETIFLVPSLVLAYFFLSPEELLSLTVTDAESESPGFDRLILNGPTCGAPDGRIVFEAAGEDGVCLMTYPVLSRVDPSALSALQGLFRLEASAVAAVEPSREELDAMGVEEPYAVVEGEAGGERFVLRFTPPGADGSAYAMRDDMPVFYRIEASDLAWMGKNYFNLMEKVAFAPDIREIAEVAVETPESSCLFVLTTEDGRLSVTADGGESVGGVQSVDVGDFRSFFRTLGSAAYVEGPEAPGGFPDRDSFAGPPELLFTYRFTDDREQTVSFYEGPLRRMYAYVGDGPGYLVASTYTDRVLQELAQLLP